MKKITFQIILLALICVSANVFSQKKAIPQKFNYKQNPQSPACRLTKLKASIRCCNLLWTIKN
jgi:hypothetical protein